MVFTLDCKKRPLMPCTEKRARLLLQRGRAVVHRRAPFTIRLKDRAIEHSTFQPLRLKLDPGARVTGVAVLREETPQRASVVVLGEIHHKPGIKETMDKRRALRRSRRSRKTRYRQPRFNNRTRKEGWLPPSLEARVGQTLVAVSKLRNVLPITAISTEHVKFDTQRLQNPEIFGIEYQHGTLQGYELREYLLEKWGRECAYCGAKHVPLQIEHIVPKSRGGTNRVSNLTVACHPCNAAKGNRTAAEFGHPQVQAQAQQPLKDAAMMNATRWTLYERLRQTGLPVECGTGARTKKQRVEHGWCKTHYYDACCVGASTPQTIVCRPQYVFLWSAIGRGTRKMCNTDAHGFPISYRRRQKSHRGFRNNDWVSAEVPRGKYAGCWIGRVAVRASGYFDIKDSRGQRICQGVSYRHMRVLQRGDGWQYEKAAIIEATGESSGSSPCLKAGASAAA